jgi:hypothetical protein
MYIGLAATRFSYAKYSRRNFSLVKISTAHPLPHRSEWAIAFFKWVSVMSDMFITTPSRVRHLEGL